ncbi:hypothetical protein SeMB42_g07746 [Synchytrium endobioticum]|nr:hypothetical protein SeMB42_g07746 [Synchytrium endobioticum]
MALEFDKIRGVLIDLSGTLHIESDPTTPNAPKALERLRSRGFKVRFITNTSKESKRDLHARLTSLGFSLSSSEIFTSISSAVSLIKSSNLRPHLLIEDAAMEDWEGIDTRAPNAVVVGLAPSKFHYHGLTSAMNILLNAKQDGGKLIAIHKGRYFETSAKGLALGPGPFVAALEYATDMESMVVGKPSPSFFHLVLQDLQMKPDEVVMIGDDVRDDVIGAAKAGIDLGILVKTGKYRKGDETKYEMQPSYTVNDFEAAVDLLCAKMV